MKNRVLLSIALCFLALETAFYFINQSNPAFNLLTLTVGNALMALLCVITFFIVKKQIDRRPEAFVRGVYGATLLKLMVCLSATLLFVLLNRPHLHKPTLFILFGIYFVYTAMETWQLSQQVRKIK